MTNISDNEDNIIHSAPPDIPSFTIICWYLLMLSVMSSNTVSPTVHSSLLYTRITMSYSKQHYNIEHVDSYMLRANIHG